jgi:hypothetical protein
MNEQAMKYLKNARSAREENNSEDAKKFYDLVRTEDPDNGEAKFFYQYYSIYEGTNREIPERFKTLINNLKTAVRCVVESNESNDEKLSIVTDIVNAFVPLTWTINRYINTLYVQTSKGRERVIPSAEINKCCIIGVVAIYDLGDLVAKSFPGKEGMALAVSAWREGVSLQQKWYAYNYDGKTVEDYAAKIQKVDPTYEIPKKAGCISFADKREK